VFHIYFTYIDDARLNTNHAITNLSQNVVEEEPSEPVPYPYSVPVAAEYRCGKGKGRPITGHQGPEVE
jgi:hypothetical protein